MAKILIVEDEKAINDLIKLNLELVGHTCFQVFDGNKALEQIQEGKYDLVLLDVMLADPALLMQSYCSYYGEKGISLAFLSEGEALYSR